jgi:hypothetical protein
MQMADFEILKNDSFGTIIVEADFLFSTWNGKSWQRLGLTMQKDRADVFWFSEIDVEESEVIMTFTLNEIQDACELLRHEYENTKGE